MNGIGVRGGAPPEVQEAQIERLMEFLRDGGGLRGWRSREYSSLASKFDPLADIPLRRGSRNGPRKGAHRRTPSSAYSVG